MNKVKSLKDILLERSVVNFDKVFLDVDQKKRMEVKKEICLPEGLFEFIQSKASEICWPIPHEYLKVCLSNREALNWTNVNLSYGLLCEEDLVKIKSDFPVRQLSFRTNRMTNEMMNFIEKIAANIEILEIMNDLPNISKTGRAPEVILRRHDPIRFPKLQKLFIDTWAMPPNLLQRFDLKSCSESLKHLSLHDIRSSFELLKTSFCLFVESFKCLQNLQILSMTGRYDYPELLDVIVHLKNLRTLDIPYIKFTNPNKIRILEVLPKLRNIQLYVYDLSDELRYLKNRKLDFVSTYYPIPKELRHLSKRIGAIKLGGFGMILNILEHSSNLTAYLEFTGSMPKNLVFREPASRHIPAPELQKYERFILVHTRWNYNKIECNLMQYLDKYWSQAFIVQYANLVVNSARHTKKSHELCLLWFVELMKSKRLKTTMLDFIILNPSSALAKMYLKHLITPATLNIDHNARNFAGKSKFINTFEVISLEWNLV